MRFVLICDVYTREFVWFCFWGETVLKADYSYNRPSYIISCFQCTYNIIQIEKPLPNPQVAPSFNTHLPSWSEASAESPTESTLLVQTRLVLLSNKVRLQRLRRRRLNAAQTAPEIWANWHFRFNSHGSLEPPIGQGLICSQETKCIAVFYNAYRL